MQTGQLKKPDLTDKVMSMATEKEVTDYLSDYISERNKK